MTDREIILALFNPQTKHADGCLWNDPHIHPRGPCICGFSEAMGSYNVAIREARKIAAGHYGASYEAREVDSETLTG
jgi:hypothetical protein